LSGILEDLKLIDTVFDRLPTDLIREIEHQIPQIKDGQAGIAKYLDDCSISKEVLYSALRLKELFGQINVVIHALGILVTLPYILEKDEIIEQLSLGAGNTGKEFDLITDRRVAEFKFINWRGGSESIRQNNVFKDFLNLLWDTSGKKKQLYLNGKKQAVSFLNGGRSLNSILSKNVKIANKFKNRYHGQFNKVSEFYSLYKSEIEIVDLNTLFPISEYINTLEV
jgi:hypothetical protein